MNIPIVTTRKEEIEDEQEIFSTSCHVFMTEPVTSVEEITRRSSAFSIEPTQIGQNEYKEFPQNADLIVETIESLYRKVDLYENISLPGKILEIVRRRRVIKTDYYGKNERACDQNSCRI